MGIILSRGGLTESQKAHCLKTGKSESSYLSELKKLPINNPRVAKVTEKKLTDLKKTISNSDKPFKPKKFSWKK